jgi:hypothetical protein
MAAVGEEEIAGQHSEYQVSDDRPGDYLGDGAGGPRRPGGGQGENQSEDGAGDGPNDTPVDNPYQRSPHQPALPAGAASFFGNGDPFLGDSGGGKRPDCSAGVFGPGEEGGNAEGRSVP